MKAKEVQAVKMTVQGASKVTYSRKNGTFKTQHGFFYRFGQDETDYAEKLAGYMPGFELVDCGEVWQAWPKDSYWWVEFRADPAECTEKLEGFIEKNPDNTWGSLYEEFRANNS